MTKHLQCSKLPEEFRKSAEACHEGATNRIAIANKILEAIRYCDENNINMHKKECPDELIIMLTQLTQLLGMDDFSLSRRYDIALKNLGIRG